MATAVSAARARSAAPTSTRVSGIAYFVLAAQFITVIMLAASMAPAYDISGGAISDLGVVPETALMFNVSLVIVGVLNVLGAVLHHRIHGRGWLLGISVAAGIGAAGAGLVPLDTSDFHGIFALVAFVFFNLQALGSAVVLQGPMRAVSLVAGAVGLAFVVIMVIGDSGNPGVFGPIGHGGAERMIVYPVMLWMMALGGYLMADPHEAGSSEPSWPMA